MRALTILTLPLLYLTAPVRSYGTGAPLVACKTMMPSHVSPTQTTPFPYKVLLNRTNVEVNTPLEIILTSKSGTEEFKGFLVQIRMAGVDANDEDMKEKTFGDFMALDDNARTLACNNTPNNALTHKSGDPKKMVKIHWMPQLPGKYRVYTTFVKSYETFWSAVPHDEVIEVKEGKVDPAHAHASTDMDYDWKTLCSDMKLNASLSPEVVSSNPYQVMIEPVKMAGKGQENHGGDNHKIPQKRLMWINVTSEIGTPIMKLFMQVRRPNNPSKAFGKFVLPKENSQMKSKLSYKLVNCFGGEGNAMLFMNLGHKTGTIADVSFQWEAPHDEVGDFEVVGTALKDEELFWDKLGEDPESSKIKVVKVSAPHSSKPGGSTSGKQTTSDSSSINSYSHMITSSFGTLLSLAFFFSFAKVV